MTNNTIPNVPRELLETLIEQHITAHGCTNHTARQAQLILCAPSPAGVDGLEVVGTLRYFMDYPDSPHSAPGYITHQFNPASWDHAGEAAGEHKLCRLSDAHAIIDGLRGEVERLQRAEKNDAIAYKAALERQDELRAELSALKAQEPVLPCELDLESSFSCAEKEASLHAGVRDTFYFALIECLQKNKLYRAPAQKELSVVMPERKKAHNCEGIEFWKANGWNDCLDELASIYAAPVSEAKAQGVVQWPEADEIMQMAFEEGQPADDASGYCFELEEFDLFIERLMSEVARLNAAHVQQPKCKTCDDNGRIGGPSFYAPDEAGDPCPDCSAPVQQVSVPDDDELSDLSSSACQMALANGVGEESFMVLARTVRDRCAMLAATAAPAADAGGVLEQAMYTLISIGYHENSGLVHELRQSLAAHRAKGVV